MVNPRDQAGNAGEEEEEEEEEEGEEKEAEEEEEDCWLLNVPETCECISGADLFRQYYLRPH